MRTIFTLLLCLCCELVHAQNRIDLLFSIQFDNNDRRIGYGFVPYSNPINDSSYIHVDTSYKNNKWQVGHPAKQHFTSARTLPNAIVTDTVNGCTPGDTSVFILKVPKDAGAGFSIFSFIYRLDKDTDDIAILELSRDTGKHWVNMFADTAFQLKSGSPNFSNSTSTWDSMAWWPVYPYFYSDFSVSHMGYFLFRFTFITGQSSTYRDGWMIDNIGFGYANEGLANIDRNIFATMSPNPANEFTTIKYSLKQRADMSVQLFDALGSEVKNVTIKNALSGQTQINTGGLPEGLYFYSMKTAYGQATGKLLVNH